MYHPIESIISYHKEKALPYVQIDITPESLIGEDMTKGLQAHIPYLNLPVV